MLIPLKKYINNWLDTYKVKDIFTGQYQYAREIFNWDKSYFLKLLIQDKYYIDTDIFFITKDKNYYEVIKTPLSQITPKKVKKYRYIKKLIPEEVIEQVIDYIPVQVKRYRMVDAEPIYNTVIKRRKIGRKYYITTEFVPTGKYRKKRQYYTDTEYIEKIRNKKRIIYKLKRVRETYYEQVHERLPEHTKIKVTEYRFYEPFFIFDYYKKLNEDEYEHYLYIAPFFDGYGTSIKIGSDEDEIVGSRTIPKFISPQELIKTQMFKSAYRECRFLMAEGKQNLKKKYFKDINERINNDIELHTINLSGSNLYSLDISETEDGFGSYGIIFFKASDLNGNKRTRIIKNS